MLHTYPVQLFRDHAGAESVCAGAHLFRRGEPGTAMFVLLVGEIVLGVDGTVVERVGAGAVFGDLELLEGRPRVADAIAVADSRVVRLDRRQFLFELQTRPHFAEFMVHELTARLRDQVELVGGRAQQAG